MSRLEPGSELAVLAVTPERYATVRYAGASGDFNPIHIDDEFARSVGLPGRILHGLYTMAVLARALTDATDDPAKLRRLAVQFRGPALPEHEITVAATVSELRGDRAIVSASVSQQGKAVIRNAAAELEL
jgi:3-hydroxybutyryl-CoA dehydratase